MKLRGREGGDGAPTFLREFEGRGCRFSRKSDWRTCRSTGPRADAKRWRGEPYPVGRATRLKSARRLLHPRRADHRPASARQPDDVGSTHFIQLEAKGNTVVVVEHDEDTIRRAEHIIDLGPGAGVNGGRLVAEGHIKDIVRCRNR